MTLAVEDPENMYESSYSCTLVALVKIAPEHSEQGNFVIKMMKPGMGHLISLQTHVYK